MWFPEVKKVLSILQKGLFLRLNTNPMYFSVSAARFSNHSVTQPKQTRTKRTIHIFRNLSSQSSSTEHIESNFGLDIKKRVPLLNEMDYKSFIEDYPAFVQDVVNLKELEGIPMMSERIKQSMDYNVPHGKLLRPLLLLATAMQTQEQSGQGLPNFNRIGWTYELVEASGLILDDVVDESITRRGRPCWYLAGNLGLKAINTGIRLQSTMNVLIKKYVKGHYLLYTEILEVLNENALRMWYGQELDGIISAGNEFQRFTPDMYTRIALFKAGYYSFYTPIILGLLLNGINDPHIFKKIERVSIDLGLLFQVQDDFLDCFVDSSQTGKVGTDIQDGKLTWLIVNAMKKATKGQRQILLDNYGNRDPEKVAVVKTIYEDLGLPKAFAEYEKITNSSLLSQIDELPQRVPKALLKQLVGILNGRSR